MAAQIASNFGMIATRAAEPHLRRLWQTRPGQKATIRSIDPTIDPAMRSRLLDLGFTPGTTIEHALTGTMGNIRAYLVRGALIALRREQADLIHVAPVLSATRV